jgi:competence protein ComEC
VQSEVTPLAPLLPVAAAVTAGILWDRYVGMPPVLAALGIAGTGLAWTLSWTRNRTRTAVLYLWTLAALLGAGWHHVRQTPSELDISRYAAAQGVIVRLRGTVLTDPEWHEQSDSPLRSRSGSQQTVLVLNVAELQQEHAWKPAAGQVRLTVAGILSTARVGDTVELIGALQAVPPPGNPGERDWQRYHRDQDIRALIHVKTPEAIEVLRSATDWTIQGLMARVRSWGRARLCEQLDPDRAGVARALLLGERLAMEPEQLDSYMRTGVFHVLAISGQHLVILCGILWCSKYLAGGRRRRVAGVVLGFALGYTLLTGARPSTVRAAVIVITLCVGIILRRRPQLVNALALAWLIVVLLNPADIFETGCQLSFLAVLVIYQVVLPWVSWYTMPRPSSSLTARENLAALLARARPWWQRLLLYPWSIERRVALPGDPSWNPRMPHWQRFLFAPWSWLVWAFLASVLIGLLIAPLQAARFHLIPPVAAFLSPLMILLTSVALSAGFLLLLLAPLGNWVAVPLAWIIDRSLAGCQWLVQVGERLPGGYWYCADVPAWWLWSFYLGLLAVLLCPPLKRYWKGAVVAGLAWLGLGLLAAQTRPASPGELRCTFLAVGHGSCVVLETPDGRVLLYDAGSLAGPEVAVWQIAPFLWSRGITRIDEVFLSHADLDHFNGVPALLDRFAVAQVSCTPSFADRPERGVQVVVADLARRGVPVRALAAGQRLQAGPVVIDVLHPPPQGPEGTENARSLVLLIQYAGRSVLLTGDLEQPGLDQVMRQPPPPVDILLAPHHGSPASNTEAFARWARPGLVISSEGRALRRQVDPYRPLGSQLWRTWEQGAVTVQINAEGIRAATFRTREHWPPRK